MDGPVAACALVRPHRAWHRANEANTQIRAWAERSIAQFRAEVVKGHVVVLADGAHYLFITNEAEVVRIIREFLAPLFPS